jgi:hypothetical protein
LLTIDIHWPFIVATPVAGFQSVRIVNLSAELEPLDIGAVANPGRRLGIREDAVLTVYVSVFAPVACSRRNNYPSRAIRHFMESPSTHNQSAPAEMV